MKRLMSSSVTKVCPLVPDCVVYSTRSFLHAGQFLSQGGKVFLSAFRISCIYLFPWWYLGSGPGALCGFRNGPSEVFTPPGAGRGGVSSWLTCSRVHVFVGWPVAHLGGRRLDLSVPIHPPMSNPPALLWGLAQPQPAPGAAGKFAPYWNLTTGFCFPAASGSVSFAITGFVPGLAVSVTYHEILEFRNFLYLHTGPWGRLITPAGFPRSTVLLLATTRPRSGRTGLSPGAGYSRVLPVSPCRSSRSSPGCRVTP